MVTRLLIAAAMLVTADMAVRVPLGPLTWAAALVALAAAILLLAHKD